MVRRTIIALALCLAALPAMAQSSKKSSESAQKSAAHHPAAAKEKEQTGDPVVAHVNGTTLYRSDLMALRATLPPEAQKQPMEQLYPRLVDQLVAMTLVAQTARKAKLNDEPRVKKMMAIAEDQILQDAYFDGIMKREITEDKLKARYDEVVKNAAPQRGGARPPHPRPDRGRGQGDHRRAQQGRRFRQARQGKDHRPRRQGVGRRSRLFHQERNGAGVRQRRLRPQEGRYTKTPVKTQFGWHVIKVEDRRAAKAPSYEQVAPQLARQMAQEIYAARVKELAATAKIEVFNADGSRPTAAAAPPARAAAPAAAPTAAATPATDPAPASMPSLLPLQNNGTPGEPPPASGPPTLAPGTQDLGK